MKLSVRKILLVAGGLMVPFMGCGKSASDPSHAQNQIVRVIVAGNANPDQLEIAAARAQLIRQCMEAKGFANPDVHAPIVVSGRSPILETGEFASVPRESVALKEAASAGFARRAVGMPGPGPHGSGGQEGPPSGDRRYWKALLGLKGQNGSFVVKGIAEHTYTTEGCIAKANTQLYGNNALAIRAEYLPEDLDIVVRHDVETNPSYLAAARRWSACMAGILPRPPSDPYALPSEISAPMPAGSKRMRSGAHEPMIATKDIRCQYDSGYIRTAVALRRRYALHVGRPYQKTLLTVIATLHRAAVRAHQVIDK